MQVYLVDPRTLQVAELSADRYWAAQFRPLASAERLEEFTVLDITPVTIAPITGAALRRKQHNHRGRRGRRGNGDSLDSDTAGGDASSSARSLSGGGSGAGAGAGAAAAGGGKTAGSKRKAAGDADRDDAASTRASTAAASSKLAGGFTGGVSLAGGSVQFNGAMSVASTVSGGPKGKFLLADAEVMRTRDMGVSDARYVVRTHLGNLLRPGDTVRYVAVHIKWLACCYTGLPACPPQVLGYDLSSAVYNEADAEAAAAGGRSRTKGTAGRAFGGAGALELPDVVLVRKCYPRRGAASSSEPWRDGDASTASVQGGGGGGKGGRAATAGSRSVGSAAEAAAAIAAQAQASGSGAAKQRVWKLRRFQDVVPTREPEFQRKGDADRAQVIRIGNQFVLSSFSNTAYFRRSTNRSCGNWRRIRRCVPP